MTTARDVIAEAIVKAANDCGFYLAWEFRDSIANTVLSTLNSAGYVIIKDHTDPEGGIPGRQI